MISQEQAEAMMENIIKIPSLEACDALSEWIRNTIGVIRGQLEVVDDDDKSEWRRRASIKIYSLEAKSQAVNRRRAVLLGELRQKIKERNIEKSKIETSESHRMFVEVCKQVMGEEEYLRIWASVREAMKETAE